jgi:fermentation-respiration switch protein FrsA (DUF1100 family)
VRATIVLVVAALILFGAGAWYFSGMIRSSALQVAPLHDRSNVVVEDAGSGWVALTPTASMSERLASDNVYGLDWGSGFGLLRGLRGTHGDVVSRELEVLSGAPPTEGTAARLTRDTYPLHAAAALGFGYRDVTYRSPAGTFPAFFAPGARDTWAILVHGRGATRAEMFRLMKVTVAAGLPSLDITYRRDGENGGGLARFGQDEWSDLEAAVRYAIDHGARNVVLAGASMGAAIVAAFEEHSPLASRTVAMVFDSAMLDFGALIGYGARNKRLPGLGTPIPEGLVWAARQLAGMRFDLDQGQLDYLDDTAWVRAPVLAVHGTEDPTVPVSLSRRLRAERPDQVTTYLVRGAHHLESWNADPSTYESKVRQFLDASLSAG